MQIVRNLAFGRLEKVPQCRSNSYANATDFGLGMVVREERNAGVFFVKYLKSNKKTAENI
jgi:hypothetical protein